MIHLVLVACLYNAPDSCVERTLSYLDVPSPTACVMRAQPELVNWEKSNPTYFVKRWHCDTDRTRRIPT